MECLWVISPIFSCYFLLVLIIRSQQTLSVLELSIGFIYAPTEPYYVYFCHQFSVLAGLYV